MTLNLISKVSKAHQESIWCCAWVKDADKPDLVQFLTGSLDGSMFLWQLNSSGEIVRSQSYAGHALGVVSLVVTKSLHIITTSVDCKIRVYELYSTKLIGLINCGHVECWSLALHPLDLYVATGSHIGQVNLYDIHSEFTGLSTDSKRDEGATRFIAALNTGKPSFVLSVACSQFCEADKVLEKKEIGKEYIIAGNKDGYIFWFLDSANNFLQPNGQDSPKKPKFSLIATNKAHEKAVRDIQFSKSNDILFTCGDDMLVKIFDVPSHSEVSYVHGHRSWVLSIAPTLDAKAFFTASADQTVKLFSSGNGNELKALSDHTDQVYQVKLDHAGKRLLSIGGEGDLHLYAFQS